MKKFFLAGSLAILVLHVFAQKRVGINTTVPLATLHVADSSVLFSATGDIPGTQGNLPQQGAGRRMLWYPVKAAFRAGYVNGAQWDNSNIGNYSVAAGFSSVASQGYSTAMGFFAKAGGVASTAFGNQTTANAPGSFSVGTLNDFSDSPDPFTENASDRIFQVGNGAGFFPSNALTVLRNGNVGLGYLNPIVPLSFNGNLGDKISLWTDGTPTHYGFGIQSGALQMFSKTNLDDIVFGYGSSNQFTENVRMKGNGYMGIGVSDPAYVLDLNGRLRIRTGSDGQAGIWLNNAANTGPAAFIGLENDNYVGFYGASSAWTFKMNTNTGALAVNGVEGSSGQILQSNGSGQPASWGSKPYGFTLIPTQYSQLDGTLLSKDIAGVDNTPFVLSQPSTVLYTLTLPVTGDGPGTIDSKGFVVVEIVDISSTRVSYASADYYVQRSTSQTQVATGIAPNLPAGLYTVKARFARLGTGDGNVATHGSFNSNQRGVQFIAQVLPN